VVICFKAFLYAYVTWYAVLKEWLKYPTVESDPAHRCVIRAIDWPFKFSRLLSSKTAGYRVLKGQKSKDPMLGSTYAVAGSTDLMFILKTSDSLHGNDGIPLSATSMADLTKNRDVSDYGSSVCFTSSTKDCLVTSRVTSRHIAKSREPD
jgi:hypothetical protein